MLWRRRVYLDYASAAPVVPAARRAFHKATSAFGNPSSPHQEGRTASALLEDVRQVIARLVEAKSDDVLFTSGATEANNLAIRGLVRPGSHVLYHPGAHASIFESVRALDGVVSEPIPLKEGKIDLALLEKRIRSTTAILSLEAVCGETGTVWATREVRAILDRRGDKRPLLHVDASQAPLTQKSTRSHFGADLLVFDAQKIGGYRGAGVLIAPRTIPLRPVLFGGGQERGLRSGTPMPALAASCAAALASAVTRREKFVAQSEKLRASLTKRILALGDGIYINEGAEVAPNILNVSFVARDTDYLVTLLDTAGFAVATRSACETDSTEGSRAVFALTGDQARAFSTLRISWGPLTSGRELDRFVAALGEALAFIDKV